MAGREISSTLRNLKFMQRAAQKEEKEKEAGEVVSNGEFVSAAAVSKKWRSDPRSSKGRMSFQHVNPSVDKLAVASDSRSSANGDSDMSDIKADHKRKQPVKESKRRTACPPQQPADKYFT